MWLVYLKNFFVIDSVLLKLIFFLLINIFINLRIEIVGWVLFNWVILYFVNCEKLFLKLVLYLFIIFFIDVFEKKYCCFNFNILFVFVVLLGYNIFDIFFVLFFVDIVLIYCWLLNRLKLNFFKVLYCYNFKVFIFLVLYLIMGILYGIVFIVIFEYFIIWILLFFFMF